MTKTYPSEPVGPVPTDPAPTPAPDPDGEENGTEKAPA